MYRLIEASIANKRSNGRVSAPFCKGAIAREINSRRFRKIGDSSGIRESI